MKRYLLILATFLIALPGLALAADCTTESVAALLGTTCSIGDLSFTFAVNGYTAGGSGSNEYAASAVLFTPTPTADSFNLSSLSGNFSSSSGAGISYGYGDLNYTVQVTDGGTLTGLTTDINGSSNSPAGEGSEAVTYALNQASLGGAYVEPDAYNAYGYAQDVTYTNNAPSGIAGFIYSSSASLPGETSEIGTATIETFADGATASLTSDDFGFVVTPPTSAPEPGVWWSLLTMGALAMIPIRRLQRR